MKKDLMAVLKRNSFAVAMIILGALIFYWTRNYKEVPSGIGPAFFPRIVAAMMIGLSVICMAMPDAKVDDEMDKGASLNIIITTVSLVVMVAIMKYIHPILGIFLFLGIYLKVIARIKTVQTAIITVAGTIVLYLVILTLRIPM